MTCLKRLAALFLMMTLLLPLPGLAAQPDAALIHGTWTGEMKMDENTAMLAKFVMRADKTFNGTMHVNGKLFWTFSGKWTIEDKLIVWHYTESSLPLAEEEKIDKDEVVAVDARRLVLRSVESGETHTFQRAKD